jgi:hypothetical protein
MRQEMLGDIFRLMQNGDRSFEVAGVPQDDRGDDQVQARSAVLLILKGAVTDFAEPMNKDGTRQAVAGFSLVQFLAGLRRSSGSSTQSRVKSVRSSLPSSCSAAATPFCRGYEASCRMMAEGDTVPVRMDATMRIGHSGEDAAAICQADPASKRRGNRRV